MSYADPTKEYARLCRKLKVDEDAFDALKATGLEAADEKEALRCLKLRLHAYRLLYPGIEEGSSATVPPASKCALPDHARDEKPVPRHRKRRAVAAFFCAPFKGCFHALTSCFKGH